MRDLWLAIDAYIKLMLPAATAGWFVIWQGRKTRRVNSDEHNTNASYSRQAAEAADRAASYAARSASASARTEGRLMQYIEDHAKVHASLPRS